MPEIPKATKYWIKRKRGYIINLFFFHIMTEIKGLFIVTMIHIQTLLHPAGYEEKTRGPMVL